MAGTPRSFSRGLVAWIGGLVRDGFRFALAKKQGTNHQSKPPVKGYLIFFPWNLTGKSGEPFQHEGLWLDYFSAKGGGGGEHTLPQIGWHHKEAALSRCAGVFLSVPCVQLSAKGVPKLREFLGLPLQTKREGAKSANTYSCK